MFSINIDFVPFLSESTLCLRPLGHCPAIDCSAKPAQLLFGMTWFKMIDSFLGFIRCKIRKYQVFSRWLTQVRRGELNTEGVLLLHCAYLHLDHSLLASYERLSSAGNSQKFILREQSSLQPNQRKTELLLQSQQGASTAESILNSWLIGPLVMKI